MKDRSDIILEGLYEEFIETKPTNLKSLEAELKNFKHKNEQIYPSIDIDMWDYTEEKLITPTITYAFETEDMSDQSGVERFVEAMVGNNIVKYGLDAVVDTEEVNEEEGSWIGITVTIHEMEIPYDKRDKYYEIVTDFSQKISNLVKQL